MKLLMAGAGALGLWWIIHTEALPWKIVSKVDLQKQQAEIVGLNRTIAALRLTPKGEWRFKPTPSALSRGAYNEKRGTAGAAWLYDPTTGF